MLVVSIGFGVLSVTQVNSLKQSISDLDVYILNTPQYEHKERVYFENITFIALLDHIKSRLLNSHRPRDYL